MNTHDLIRNKGLLAIILGVAVIASAGGLSAVYADTGSNQTQTLKPKILGSIPLNNESLTKVTVNFAVAANTAATAPGITGGKVVSGNLIGMQGFLVYSFRVVDSKNLSYSVIVDPGNGTILHQSQGHAIKFGGFGIMGHGFSMKKGGFKHGGGQWGKHAPGNSTAPSGTQ